VKRVLITGIRGFVGSNLETRLGKRSDLEVLAFDIDSGPRVLRDSLERADIVFHLAGVNRPSDPGDFEKGNHVLTRDMVDILVDGGKHTTVVASSSTQAALDNPYGASKRRGEEELERYSRMTGALVYVYRLTNVFGKWSRPNYNSVVATFCDQISKGQALRIDDPQRMMEFNYVDDVVGEFERIVDGRRPASGVFCSVEPVFRLTVKELADRLSGFHVGRWKMIIPDFSDRLTRYLYATYLSYVATNALVYPLVKNTDTRGYLAEFLKSNEAGQVFISRTLPGITRGNHFHDTKTEKFFVLEGKARISLRHLKTGEKVDYMIEGTDCRVVDIPPGYAHSITNIGDRDLVVLFWANEIFDERHPDTYREAVE
jgi:UDP-2-acetamido-2,6-beta-L-arabino-hexul-4-ose reductase